MRADDPAPSRTVIIAGAGIGGLTAALALLRSGFRVIVLEQAERLEETGAGIQLSPNATRTLIELGLQSELRRAVVAPTAMRVLSVGSGREIVRMPLGDTAERRYGAPYWLIHRGDLHRALAAAASNQLGARIKLGVHVEDFSIHRNGLTVAASGKSGTIEEHGAALLGADGLWSAVRRCLGHDKPPRFTGRTAWRALVPAREVAPEFREPIIHLWLGRDTHLVHYPVKSGSCINIVAITKDRWNAAGWSEPASRADFLACFSAAAWALRARALVELPDAWLKWALYDRPPIRRWSRGRAALLGDAAHPMLPYLAQGAAMAIEDAAVAAQCMAHKPDDPAAALVAYCAMRRARTRTIQRLAARNGWRFHLGGIGAWMRDIALQRIGGEHLLRHYDWVYGWRFQPA
jgi:salicylate hydroxylase